MSKFDAARKALGNLAEAILPMDKASRMQRAEDMGFDTEQVWYHGTDADEFDFFDLSRGGQNFGDQESKEGIFLTDQIKNAENYGDNILNVRARFHNPYTVDAKKVLLGEYDYLKERGEFSGDFDSFISDFLEDDPYSFYESGELLGDIMRAKSSGHDALIVDFGDIDIPRGGKVAVAFNPQQLRLDTAAFDPAKRDSANLLAQIAGAAPLPLAALGAGGLLAAPEEAEAEESRQSQEWRQEEAIRQLNAIPQDVVPGDVGSIRPPMSGRQIFESLKPPSPEWRPVPGDVGSIRPGEGWEGGTSYHEGLARLADALYGIDRRLGGIGDFLPFGGWADIVSRGAHGIAPTREDIVEFLP